MSPREIDIPLTRPVMDEAEQQAVARVLRSGWVTQGPEVAQFEADFAHAVGTNHACAVSSCTAALHLALLAAGVRPGDHVATVSHSYIATANSIRACGATPVFVDIQPDTFNIDPRRLEASLSEQTRAVVCVHQLGLPCDLSAVTAIAHSRDLPVIEDAACAAGSVIRWNGEWQPIGAPHGDIACFSFHPRKLITTGEGGMITTRHADWDAKCRRLRQHGALVSDAVRHTSQQVVFEQHQEVGFNYRMTDLQAAVGRVQLARLPALIRRRRELAAAYQRLLAGFSGLSLPLEPEWARSNWQSYCVRLGAGYDRQAIMQRMLDEGIATRAGVMCAHREPAYAEEPWIEGAGGLAESERAQDRGMMLPLFHGMTESDQQRVAESLEQALRAGRSLAADPA